jgi:penicillin-binding protein 1C
VSPQVKRRAGLAAIAGLGLYAAVHLAARLLPLPEGYFAPGSTMVEFKDGSAAHVFLSPDEKWRVEVSLSEVDPDYLAALVRLEDKRFYDHGGVDPIAIVRAAGLNLWRRRVVSGASTLTMQLVRVREPRRRSLGSKVIEAFRALQIEARYDKQEILERYLQYTPYGRNIEGIEAASLAYFGHRAGALSPDEIAVLLAVPQNPNRRYPDPKNLDRLKLARDDIGARLCGWGIFGADAVTALAAIQGATVPGRLVAFPRHAPHAAVWLRRKHPEQRRLRTTLDRGAQTFAERTVKATRAENERLGIHNAAAVIADHHTGEIRALVGNFDFYAGGEGGQLVAFDQPRSPGSALKPFIYGLGIDSGKYLPEYLVLDTPVHFGGYSPENYDGRFQGLVELESALSQSLNVPFVLALEAIGVERFVSDLRVWGLDHLVDDPGYYGLSAAIGSLEVTPLEMAGLYAMLAEGGRFRELIVEPTAPGKKRFEIQGLSEGATYLTRRALRLRDRPDFPARRRYSGAAPSIHWKTGTSYGHRDAWAAGSGAVHTAVVWLGNLDHSPSAHLVGADAAGPILFDLIEGLERDRKPVSEVRPASLKEIDVCAYSGRIAGSACPRTKRALALRTVVPTAPCPYHAIVDVERQSGLALSPSCREGHRYDSKSFLVWPASLRRYLSAEHRQLPSPPALAPGCGEAIAKCGPSILTPAPHQTALLMADVGAESQEIPLSAESSAGKLSWFVDGEFLGTVPAEDRVWWRPRIGRHEIVVSDESGQSARRVLQVKQQL